MQVKQEMRNFIDHYGIRDTLDALDHWIQSQCEEESLKDFAKDAIKEFVEQQSYFFDWE